MVDREARVVRGKKQGLDSLYLTSVLPFRWFLSGSVLRLLPGLPGEARFVPARCSGACLYDFDFSYLLVSHGPPAVDIPVPSPRRMLPSR